MIDGTWQPVKKRPAFSTVLRQLTGMAEDGLGDDLAWLRPDMNRQARRTDAMARGGVHLRTMLHQT
eukprot:5982646-Amphidinium_carterae.1